MKKSFFWCKNVAILMVGVIIGIVLTQWYVIEKEKVPLRFLTVKKTYDEGNLRHERAVSGIVVIHEGKKYYPNGKVKYEYVGDYYSDFYVKEYYEAGGKKSSYSLRGLILDGHYVEFNTEGKLLKRGVYDKGKFYDITNEYISTKEETSFQGFENFEVYEVYKGDNEQILFERKYKNGVLIQSRGLDDN